MTTLFIDTHMSDLIISLYDENSVIHEEKVLGINNNSKYILPTIEKVVKDNSYDEIVVVNGPGSFTGARLGVTIAKTLAYTQNIPIQTIDNLQLMAIMSENADDKVVAFNDRNGYFIGYFDKNNIATQPYEYLRNNEFAQLQTEIDVVTDVSMDYVKLRKYTQNKHYLNPHSVKPIYVKKIDVEK